MKETIAFPQLAGLVAEKASTTERMSELFLQELFAIVTQELVDGKAVTIKGLGSFKTTKDTDAKDVTFTPDKDLAEAVNAPFAQFEPVELCDEVTDEMLSDIDSSMEQSKEQEPQETATPHENVDAVDAVDAIDAVETVETVETMETVDAVGTMPESLQEQSSQQEETAPVLSTPAPSHVEDTQDIASSTKSNNSKIWIIAGIAAIALIAAWYFYTHRSKDPNDKHIETAQIAASKSETSKTSEAIKPQPIVTDTIGGGNVLFTMAKKHYGDQAFWVYIARENQAQYPDYRKIRSGAVLAIPPAEKYGINSDSKQSIKQANAEAMKLYKEVKAKDKNESTQTSPTTSNSKSVSNAKQSQWKGKSKKNYRQHYRSAHNRYRRR